MIYKIIGWYLKRQRIRRGYTLREYCISFQLDASTISRIERGYYFKVAPEEELMRSIRRAQKEVEAGKFLTHEEVFGGESGK